MDALKLHLLLNYYPAIGMVIGSLVLAAGWWRNRARTQRFGIKVVLITVVVAIAVAFTGEFAGLAAEPPAGPRADALNAHKLNGTAALATAVVAGVIGLIALIRGRADAERPKRLYAIAMILAVASSVLFIATIFKGRQVKWAANNATQINRPSKLENKLWHA